MSDAEPRIREVLQTLATRRERLLVALDFDGTLASIVPRPEDARALPGVPEALADLARRVARVAVVTGRPVAEAVRFGRLDDVPGLVVLGHYGLERWEGGEVSAPPRDPVVDDVRQRLEAVVADYPGVSLEAKGHSVAVHTRQAPDPAEALAALRPHVVDLAEASGLQVTPGRFVLEVRPRSVDKGAAVTALVRETSARAVLYAGDDVGDLPALVAVRSLAADGVAGVVVCSDAEEASPEFRAGADLVVDGPAGVLQVLRELADLP